MNSLSTTLVSTNPKCMAPRLTRLSHDTMHANRTVVIYLWSAHTLSPTLPWWLVHMNSPVGETVTLVTAFLNHIQSTHLPVGRSHILYVRRYVRTSNECNISCAANKYSSVQVSKRKHDMTRRRLTFGIISPNLADSETPEKSSAC